MSCEETGLPHYIECSICGAHMKPKAYYSKETSWKFWHCSWCGNRW